MQHMKPVVFLSRCIEFEKCRYNGAMISSEVVQIMKDHVNFITVCPECEIGLGIPRDPIRIIQKDGDLALVQPSTERDITKEMKEYTEKFLATIDVIDGFILKSGSPSCAPTGAKVYPSMGKGRHIAKSGGFFGKRVMEKYPYLNVEDEGRLRNYSIREHFFTSIFMKARLNSVEQSMDYSELVKFHSNSKYLLMGYNQSKLKELGKIVASGSKKDFLFTFIKYKKVFLEIFEKMPRISNNINVLQHIAGYFKKDINKDEKAFLNSSFDDYVNKRLPLSVPANILRSMAIRFNKKYLLDQFFFEPFPRELEVIKDSGEGRRIK